MFNGISMEFTEYLNEDAKKKKRTLSVYQGHYIRYWFPLALH